MLIVAMKGTSGRVRGLGCFGSACQGALESAAEQPQASVESCVATPFIQQSFAADLGAT